MYNGEAAWGGRKGEVLIRDGLSRYPGCQENPIWTKLGSNNWHGVDDSAYGYGRSSFLFPGMHAHLFTNSRLHQHNLFIIYNLPVCDVVALYP